MTATQLAVLFPAILFWLMLIVQYGLGWHAKQVANAAAAEAVDAAQIRTGTAAEGEAAAVSYLAQSGNLTGVSISVDRGPAVVTAEVRGAAPQLVPGFSWSVAARSQAPVERFIPEPER
ncbi:MAG TPA: TadE/TadG family type IV pilus assembly protein [Egicoccus sp.]|nr:TadE/TadG family type IV pilus assembly protein [Egicoccus sp.]HSK21611.1 TadE/TadG family type IV pilus assembly protein [Egicoccus sp.]